jgi:HJR/Mrr/RecB family endonuclease
MKMDAKRKNNISHVKGKEFTTGGLAAYLTEKGLRVTLVGNPELVISRVNTLEDSQQGDITFLANRKYVKLIDETNASAIILPESMSSPRIRSWSRSTARSFCRLRIRRT